jgi:amidase
MAKSSPLHYMPAKELARLLRRRKLGALELLDHYWQRYESLNPKLNAIIVTDIDRARRAARKADRRVKRDHAGLPVEGVPMTIKESFDWQGTPSTWGAPAYRDNIAGADAIAVNRMEKEGGAVIFGKTNVPLMLADWQPSTRSTAPPTIHGISPVRPAALRAALPRRSPPA